MNLVTGATGLIGAHVALKLLQQNKTVVALKQETSDVLKTKNLFSYYSDKSQELFDKIKWVDGDICDIYSLLNVIEGISVVYHCAGFVSFNGKHQKKLHKINVEGTANIVNVCLEKKLKLCHVSSIATLNNPDISANINEHLFWKFSPKLSDYAISKYNAEREVWRGIEEGLDAVIVNPGIVLGPGFWEQSSGKLFETCFKGISFYTEGSSATIDAMDVAKCMVQLIEKKVSAQRFILIENNYTYKHIFSLIHIEFNNKIPSIMAGKKLLTIARFADAFYSFLTNKEQGITKATAYSAQEKNTFNNAKIKETISVEFIPLTQTIQFICHCYPTKKTI